MNKRKKNRLILLVGVLFFFGFPLAGMLFVYNRAHSVMRIAAIPFAQETAAKILKEQDYEELNFLSTLTLKKTLTEEGFQADMDEWGGFIALGEFAAVRSRVSERGDMTWQYVHLVADVKFENGAAKLKFTAARRSTMLRDWKIEEWELSDPTVE